jgi:glycosyltransferase involved in cell wall biosynthesis
MRYLVDHEGSFSQGIVAHWEKQGHEVVCHKDFDPSVAARAEILWLEWGDANAIAATNAGRRWPGRTICRVHRYEIPAGFLAKVQFDLIDDVVFVSPHFCDVAKEKYPNLRQTRTHIIPNGLDIDKFPYAEHEHGNVVGIVGIMRPLTQPDLLITIAEKYPDYIFRWAGQWADWMDRRYVKQWMASKPDNIQCLGWLSQPEMARLLPELKKCRGLRVRRGRGHVPRREAAHFSRRRNP